ncbi:30S ribosomal protein S14 [Candidatus Woesearchaeota archaeon]|nr:30S ribosomal protein S14 [Candidatus Woesearchaeota archaeon]MBT5397327.1 30S ribosomal protein S14 [Candidatus Woesearchaeota archaeon]MBT5924808.1 30S ribosomal protein S14 [Candidatus Woesearchaeota archaeon]MBT6367828.1 30S ribosomal protein S14 [Candidatus Woesearchaeota archaeon]MBT7762727.1 30S ribosomal protein S14 [Candidatus Woesearchaeota archaeon]
MFTQLNAKPIKKIKYLRFNAPKERSCGIALRKCKNCGRMRGHINKYGLHLCRQCFREMATELGFKKYN